MDSAGCATPAGSSRRSFAAALQQVATGRFFPFLACIAGSFLIFFLRNPDPWLNPTLYAEDGYYVALAYGCGFWEGLSKARADYFVFGNFFCGWLSVQICRMFFHDDVLLLPRIIAVVSYSFFAMAVSLPVVLLRTCFRLRYLVVLCLASSFFPLEQFDNEVLGRLANIGFAFLYIALLLIWYRNNVARAIWEFLLVDLGLLACAATNPLALAILPLTGLRYLHDWLRRGESLPAITLKGDFLCLSLLAVACFPLAYRIATAEPTHMAEGPLLWDSAIEMLVARNFLHVLLHPFYGYLNHLLAIGIFVAALVVLLLFHDRRHRQLYGTGLLVLALVAITALIDRPALLQHIGGYRPSPACRYFYAQGLIVLLLAARFAADIMESSQFPRWVRILPLGLVVFFFSDVDRQSSYGVPASPQHELRALGSFEWTLQQAVEERQFVDEFWKPDPDGDYVRVRIYPTEIICYTILPRRAVEQAVQTRPIGMAADMSEDRTHL